MTTQAARVAAGLLEGFIIDRSIRSYSGRLAGIHNVQEMDPGFVPRVNRLRC